MHVAMVLAAACGGEDKPIVPGVPTCDGLLQEGEETIDSPFDADGDGYFDASNQGCAATYDPYILDCDDAAYERHPGAPEYACNDIDDDCNEDTPDSLDNDGDRVISCDDCDDGDASRSPIFTEICWDEIDNDCDGIVDPGCGYDYNGIYTLEAPVTYKCALGLVDIDFQSVTVLFNPPYASMTSNETTQPGTLNGEIAEDGSFVFELAIVLGTALSCSEFYRISGAFVGPDRFEATFESVFTGVCANCEDQTVEGLVGVREI